VALHDIIWRQHSKIVYNFKIAYISKIAHNLKISAILRFPISGFSFQHFQFPHFPFQHFLPISLTGGIMIEFTKKIQLDSEKYRYKYP